MALERLLLLIDANGKPAQAEFARVGAAANKNLGDVEKRLDRISGAMTKWGAATVAGAGVVGAALFASAKAYDEAEKNQIALTNSVENSSQEFKGGGKALADYAQSLQKVTAADGDAIVGAQSVLVQFGLTEKQVRTLTPLVVDLSRKMGVDLDVAAKAVGKATDGSTGALSRYGIVIDESAAKTDAFGATVDGLRSKVGGFAEAEGKTFSGQVEILKNNLGDLQETVGKGAIDVFGGIAGAAAGAAGKLGEVNPALSESVGKILAIGSITAGGLGGLSVITGQLIKMREMFTTVGADGERSLTRLGVAMKGVGMAAGALALTEATFAVLNEAAGVSRDATAALDDFTLAAERLERGSKGGADAVVDAFGKLVGAEQNTLRVQNLWQEFGAEVSIVGTDIKADIEQVQRAFDQLGDQKGPKAQIQLLDEWEKANNQLDKNSDQYRTNKRFIDDNRAAVEKHAKALATEKDAQADATDETDKASKSVATLTGALSAYSAKLKLASLQQDSMAEGARAFGAALEASTTLDDEVDNALKLGDNMRGFREQIKNLPGDIDTMKLALGGYNEEQSKAIGALVAAGDANRDYLSGLIAQGETVDQVQLRAAALRGEYERQAHQVGLNDEQTQRYLETLGLTPEQVNTAITLSGVEEARQKLTLLQQFIDGAFGDSDEFGRSKIELAVGAKIAEGDLSTAAALYGAWVTDIQDKVIQNPIVQAVIADTSQATTGVESWKAGLTGADPTNVPIGADASRATFDVQAWAASAQAGSFGIPAVPVEGDTTQGAKDVAGWKAVEGANGLAVPVTADTAQASSQMAIWRRANGTAIQVPVQFVGPLDTWSLFGGRGKDAPAAATTPKATKRASGPPWPGANGRGGIDFNIWTEFAVGGRVPGSGDRDTVPAMLTPGEFVIPKDKVKALGVGFFDSIRTGRIVGLNAGGLVPTPSAATPALTAAPQRATSEASMQVERGPLIGTLVQNVIEAEASPRDLARGALRAAALVGWGDA